MELSLGDKIEVFHRCFGCFGQKVVKDNAGNEIACSQCNGIGEIAGRVLLSDLVEFLGQEIANTVRLRTGRRS